jgi:fatty-acyl-CoA synthase
MNISGQEPSYEAGPRTTTLLSETIGANFERTAATHPDIEALVDALTGQRWTYHQLDNEINVVAKALIAQGISAGDRIGLWAANCAEWVVLQYATAKAGAILVTINPAY